ncbi:uncharacterized protein LOC107039850 [Diachasma alloeum]|uniref:uncharacterized protein LOC107039850 n=1 Tax=Diachasma alloeum TaxID=454923 RepID=UPI0007384BA2|nr:uncharacterized protein LOC107039850 [Diachasma alloeum]
MERMRGSRRAEDKHSGLYGDGNKRVESGSVIALPLDDVRKNSPINILKRSIRRAWTINGPPGRWTISRKSPAFRLYRSLPLSRNNRTSGGGKIENAESLKTEIERKVLSLKTESLNLRNKSNPDGNEDDSAPARGTLAKPTGKNLQKFIPESKASPKYGERKSNIPIYRRNSREFEDIGSPRESPRRSLIPQRYRGSTDDLRRYREEGNIPSLIPKLSQKSKEEKALKREKFEAKSSPNIRRELREREDSRLRYSPTNFRRTPKSEENLLLLKPQPEPREDQDQGNLKQEIVGEIKQGDFELEEKFVEGRSASETSRMANEKIVIDECHDVKDAANDEKHVSGDSSEDRDSGEGEKSSGDVMDTSNTSTASDTETQGANIEDIKNVPDANLFKKSEEIQVIRRKYSKEEFSNTDDTDDAPNRRSSSHLSPEASPLSTRSSRYSPRESESEPTPALPRKTQSGESSISSQRIRDAITRTRRESNSSTRYESSGSESIRLSESGLHGYVDLARKVRLFDSSHCCPGASIDEPIQRDSATSAGEDEPHEDFLSRDPGRLTGTSTQGRTILRRRRQFDAQGSRRRGRSHARTCCSEEFSSLQAGRQCSPSQGQIQTHGQDQLNPDYRRLVFISSDSSSGREEDDADSSCSGSSYLNGLPRGSHAQGLEDCDWDYFESGTLPLPTSLSDGINIDGITNVSGNTRGIIRDWSCCPGRGSAACSACGGSTSANVLPVPVPIPVPVPYPVPIPAALWNGDFAAAASSMITGNATPEGTLRLRGDPTAPWFSWHPRFTHPLDGAVQRGSRIPSGGFDPSIFTFRPDGLSLGQFENIRQGSLTEAAASKEERTDEKSSVNKNQLSDSQSPFKDQSSTKSDSPQGLSEACKSENHESEDPFVPEKEKGEDPEDKESRKGFRLSHDDSGSSSGRSSADSSDLDESASHHFSRVFVVNDDSLTSDNDMEEIDENDEAESQDQESGMTLKRVVPLSDEEQSVVLRRIRLIDKDLDCEKTSGDSETSGEWITSRDLDHDDKNPPRNDGEIYLADSIDYSDSNHVQLRSIRNINPELLQPAVYSLNSNQSSESVKSSLIKPEDQPEEKSWDSTVMPDSLEVANTSLIHSHCSLDAAPITHDNLSTPSDKVSATTCKSQGPEACSKESKLNSSTESSETNTSEFSSDELHEYDVTSYVKSPERFVEKLLNKGARTPDEFVHKATPFPKRSRRMPNSEALGPTEDPKAPENFTEEKLVTNESEIIESGVLTRNDESRDTELNLNDDYVKPLELVHKTTPFSKRPGRMPDNEALENFTEEKLVPNESGIIESGVSTRNNESKGSELNLSDEFHDCDVTSYVKPAERFVEKLLNKGARAPDEFVHKTTPFPKYPRRMPSNEALGSPEDPKALEHFTEEKLVPNESGIIESGVSTRNDDSRDTELNLSCESDMREGNVTVRGEKTDGVQVGDSEDVDCECSSSSGERTAERGKSRYRSVERRPPTRKENGEFSPTFTSSSHQPVKTTNFGSCNKYKSLVMITQGTYQPVSVITSDTTTLLEPDDTQTPQGLAGYYHLALEAVTDTPRSGQGPRRPLMVKRLCANTQEQEIDSGLSVGSASESDDVQSVKNTLNFNVKNDNEEKEKTENSGNRGVNSSSGVVILEEGLADDDSWVEEVSHDEDEQSATATEESSEDECNNLGDREEELRGYHRQAIDFTLHTIVEESCEESEAEPSLGSGNFRKRQRPPSTSELEKYFFFGLGGDVSSGGCNSGREVDSLSETSSIYSEGLESLGQDEVKEKGSDFSNSSRLEKYFLSEFLGFDQDRRDSDGSVGSDSEGRPSPEAQRRKRLVRARGTGRSHSSSLDNLLALTQSSQNLTSQNSLQDLSMNQDSQETQSEGSSTETDGAEDAQTPVFGTDGQFDTVKRKKKKPRTLGTQSPRVVEDRSNKSPEPRESSFAKSSETLTNDLEQLIHSDDERSKTPQPELNSFPSSSTSTSSSSSSPDSESNFGDTRGKQQSRDSGFVGSCDDLLQHRKSPTDPKFDGSKDSTSQTKKESGAKADLSQAQNGLPPTGNPSLSRKDSFNNWSSDEETNLMMSKMRQFFKTMVANSNVQPATPASNSTGPSPVPSPRLSGCPSSKSRMCPQNRTKPPQLVYFENELTRLMKTVPGIRDEQVREIVEYLSSEDTWSDSYDSSDYTSSDLEGASGRRSALQEQISQSCQQIISKFDMTSDTPEKAKESSENPLKPQSSVGRDTAFVYQKLVQSFTKMTGDGVSSDASSTPHSSPPLIAKVMHHIGSRLVALMHEVSEGTSTVQPHPNWRRYSQHHRTPSSASTTEDDESTSDSTVPSHFQLPRSKSHDPLLLINGHPTAATGQEGEEREASDYERFSWRGSFESALMAADSRTKLSLLACSGDVNASASASALAMAAKRRSAGDLLFNPKSFSREQLDRVRSCGSIGGGNGIGGGVSVGGSIEEKIWSNRRSSVPDANTRGESGASAGDEDTEDELEYTGDPRATTLPRGMQVTTSGNAATNSLPRLPASSATGGASMMANTAMHKAHSMYHFLPQHTNVKSARYRPPGFARNSLSNSAAGAGTVGPKRAFSAPGLQIPGSQAAGKRESSRSRRQQAISLAPDDGSSLSEACSTPIIGASPRSGSSRTVMDIDDTERGGLHSAHHLNTRASLSSLGARSDSMASVYSGAGEGRWCGSVAVRGEVEFSLQYDYKQLTFEVHVSQCRDLAPVDIKRNRSDPYVKVYLLPDKSKGGKRKTKVKKHTLNPVFDETLKFHIGLNGLETRTLWLTVWHSDMFGRNDFLGEVRMPLENKIFDDPTPRWYPLQERTEPFDDPIAYKGEVIVGLKFVPPDPAQLQERENIAGEKSLVKGKKNWSRGGLHVLVKEARNLQTRAKNSGTCDPFCKSYLLPDKGRSGKQKTGVVRRSNGSPVWGHTFVYKDVSIQELAERGLELTVWDHDRIASNEFLGGVRFNLGTGKHYGKPVDWMDATGRELSLWQSMLERPNFWVEGAVTLRPNLHNHGKSTVS